MQYKTIDIELKAGQSGKISDFDFTLAQEFGKVTGVVIYRISGNEFFNFGLSDLTQGAYHDLTHIEDWLADKSVPLNERYKIIHIPCRGQELNLDISIPKEHKLQENQIFQVVFRVEKNEAS
jgi:hypothetical protein